MKKSVIAGVVLVIAGIIGIISTFSPNYNFSFGTKLVKQEASVPLGQIAAIQVASGDTDVDIIRGNSDTVKVTLAGRISPKYIGKVKLNTKLSGDTLRIETVIPGGYTIGLNILNLNLTVELPAKSWDNVKVEVGSGDIKLASVQADEVNISSGSGDMTVSDVEAKRLILESGSGNQKLSDLRVETITATMNSGNIAADRFQSDSLTFGVGSGDIRLTDGQGELNGKTGSGNIKVEFEALTQNAKLKTGSGDVTVMLAEDPPSLGFEFRTGSGDHHIDWNYMADSGESKDDGDVSGVIGSGNVKLDVQTGSGNFKLLKQ